jgi:ATPase subunit of ABC transporter with duplicated ATPase domains
MKRGFIEIHDSKRRVMVVNQETDEKERKTVYGYVIKSVGKNGEILQCSETFNDAKAVKTHLNAMNKLWNNGEVMTIPLDYTAEQKFVKFGLAEPGN